MSNLHRIIWIDRQIRNGKYPDRKSIADKFEISIRQAARDIEYMKYSLGASIEYSAYHKGYYYSDKNFTLPSNFLNDNDRKMLKYLAYQYANQKEDNSYTHHRSAQLADLFLRLSREKEILDNNQKVGKNQQIFRDGKESKDNYLYKRKELPLFQFTSKEAEVFDLLKIALKKSKKVDMNYQNAEFKDTRRIFCPYKLFYQQKRNYVVGFCQLREEIRIFRLDRIKNLLLLDEKFEKVSFFREEDYSEDLSFSFRSPYKAIIIFDKVEDANGLQYNIRYRGNGSYEVEFYNSQEFLLDIMGRSLSFTIKYPNWLKNKLKEKIGLLLTRNNT